MVLGNLALNISAATLEDMCFNVLFATLPNIQNRPFLGRFHYWLPATQVTIYRRRFITPCPRTEYIVFYSL